MSISHDKDAKSAIDCVVCFHGTDVGRCREENQDTYGIIERDSFKLFLVADGMGGVKGGSIASRLAVDVLTSALEDGSDLNAHSLITATNHANSVIFEKGLDDNSLTGMGTTLVGLGFSETKMWILNVGDSRAYRIRDKKIRQLTTDHTLISELLRSGAIPLEQVSNHPVSHMLTRSLGPTSTVEVDCGLSRSGPIANDMYLLCSDGLYNHVSDAEIMKIINELGAGDEAVDQLIKRANQRGGTDNITVIIVQVGSSFPIRSADELDGDEDPGHSTTLEMPVGGTLDDNETTLELEANYKSDAAAVHRDRLFNRYKHIYDSVVEHGSSYPDRRLVKLRFVGTIVALLLVMVGSYQLGFLFAGSSQNRIIGKLETDALPERGDLMVDGLMRPLDIIDSPNDSLLGSKEHFKLDSTDLELRLGEIGRSLERLDRYLVLVELPDKSGVDELLSRNEKAIIALEDELVSVRAELDVVTRELALWYGRRQRIKEIDGLRIAKEVAAGSKSVRDTQSEFEETTWAYLNAAERLRYNPSDKELRNKVYELKNTRLRLRDELVKLVEQEILTRVDEIDNRVAQLTIARDGIERELGHLSEEREILQKIKADDPARISVVVDRIQKEQNSLRAEYQELQSLLR